MTAAALLIVAGLALMGSSSETLPLLQLAAVWLLGLLLLIAGGLTAKNVEERKKLRRRMQKRADNRLSRSA